MIVLCALIFGYFIGQYVANHPTPTTTNPPAATATETPGEGEIKDSDLEILENYLTVLRNEFEAGDDSFLIQLRPHLVWDKKSFSRLIAVM